MARRRASQAEIVRLFADRLRDARHSRNMTQSELADRTTLPASYVSDLENGKVAPGIDLVDRLAKALDTTVTDLLPASAPRASDLREEVKVLFDDLVRTAERDVLLALKSLLPLLREVSSSRQ